MPTILITGTNRGIGLEFAKRYVEDGWTVICAVRDPSKMPKLQGKGDVKVIKLDSGVKGDADIAVKQLQEQGVKSLDVVIANAAINLVNDQFHELDSEVLEQTIKVNVTGVMLLFQATLPLLLKAEKGQFAAVSSGAGTINKEQRPGSGAYGLSKAALNYMIRKMDAEHNEIAIIALNPGWVPTEMGNLGAKWAGLANDRAPEDINETAPGMMNLIAENDKEKYGGWMTNWDGKRMDF